MERRKCESRGARAVIGYFKHNTVLSTYVDSSVSKTTFADENPPYRSIAKFCKEMHIFSIPVPSYLRLLAFWGGLRPSHDSGQNHCPQTCLSPAFDQSIWKQSILTTLSNTGAYWKREASRPGIGSAGLQEVSSCGGSKRPDISIAKFLSKICNEDAVLP